VLSIISFTCWWWWGPYWTKRRQHCRKRRMERGDIKCRQGSTTRECTSMPSEVNWKRKRVDPIRRDLGQMPLWRENEVCDCEPELPLLANYLITISLLIQFPYPVNVSGGGGADLRARKCYCHSSHDRAVSSHHRRGWNTPRAEGCTDITHIKNAQRCVSPEGLFYFYLTTFKVMLF